MSSNLPQSVAQAGTFFQSPLSMNDAAYRRKIIDWGYQQIDEEYLPSPFKAGNLIRREMARREWDRVIRTNGRELRNLVAGHAVDQLRWELDRYRANVAAADAEALRRDATIFDSDLRGKELSSSSQIIHKLELEKIRLEHQLSEQAEDAASRRRKEERINDSEQDIAALIIAAVVRSMGESSADQMIDASRKVNEEIARIKRDPNLSDDDRHLAIKSLLDTLPAMMRNMRANDV